MKIQCSYSGLSFQVDTFSHKWNVESIHPIFHCSKRQLLQRTNDWMNGRFNSGEIKLYFLALCHATELVDFKATAYPTQPIMQQCIAPLLEFLAWREDSLFSISSFPRYAITEHNHNMQNFPVILTTWLQYKNPQFYRQAMRAQKMGSVNTEAALMRMIKSTFKNRNIFLQNMSNWAMEAASVPAHTRDAWNKIFILDYNDFDLYSISSDVLESMHDWMVLHLEVGSINSHAVLEHCRQLKECNAMGFDWLLGIRRTEENDDGKSYEIMEDEEIAARELAVINAPESKPSIDQYPGELTKFLIAKARWELAESQRAKVASVAAEEDKLIADTISSTEAALAEDAATQQTDEEIMAELLLEEEQQVIMNAAINREDITNE